MAHKFYVSREEYNRYGKVWDSFKDAVSPAYIERIIKMLDELGYSNRALWISWRNIEEKERRRIRRAMRKYGFV